jgi:hypothetical protein
MSKVQNNFLLSVLVLGRLKATQQLLRDVAHWEQQARIARRAATHCELPEDQAHFARSAALATAQAARLERLIERRTKLQRVELQAVFGAARLNWLQQGWYEAV